MIASKDEILSKIKEVMDENFEIDSAKVTLEAKLVDDLDIDSIDAVDLIVSLQNFSQKRFSAEDFKSVKTVGDIVDIVHAQIHTASS